MLGILSSDVRWAVRALRDWTEAFELPFVPPVSRVPGVPSVAQVRGTCYLKYNPVSGVCYVSEYQGKDRGVLVQLGQASLGHFPLGLWDEDMTRAAPTLSR